MRRRKRHPVLSRFLPVTAEKRWTVADARWLAVELAAYRDALAAAEQLMRQEDLWDRWQPDSRTRGLALVRAAGESPEPKGR